MRVIAGFNVGVLAVAIGLVLGRLAKTPIEQLWPGHWWALRTQAPGLVQTAAQSTSAVVRSLGRELENYVYVAGPRSPLWQAENGHLAADDGPHEHKPSSGPCAEDGGPEAREREGEREGIGPTRPHDAAR